MKENQFSNYCFFEETPYKIISESSGYCLLQHPDGTYRSMSSCFLSPVTEKSLKQYLGITWRVWETNGFFDFKQRPYSWYIFDLKQGMYKENNGTIPECIPQNIKTFPAFAAFAYKKLLKRLFEPYDFPFLAAFENDFYETSISVFEHYQEHGSDLNTDRVVILKHVNTPRSKKKEDDDIAISIELFIKNGEPFEKIIVDAGGNGCAESEEYPYIKICGWRAGVIVNLMKDLGVCMSPFNEYSGNKVRDRMDFS